MKMKKILAGVLSAAMVASTMVVPSFAANDAEGPFDNLTAFNLQTFDLSSGAILNEIFEEGTSRTTEFAVCGANQNWVRGYLSDEQAASVHWDVLPDSISGVTVTDYYPVEVEEGGYISFCDVDIAADADSGFAVIEASMGDATTDFTVVVNPTKYTSVTNITNYFYDATGASEQLLAGPVTCATVSGNNHYGDTQYASVLDLPMALVTTAGSGIENYRVTLSDGTYFIDSFTIADKDGKSAVYANNDTDKIGWQYRVYDSDDNLKPLSELVGADLFELENNDTVIWKYGTYEGTTFPDSLK